MFDFVHKKRRIVQIILALATLPFLFWGIESYRSGDGEDNVAFAAGEKISRQEFDQALRNQKENMRAAMGESFNEALMERPEVRAAVLDGLIRQRLLRHEAARVGLAVPDAQLVEMIQNIADFQEDGSFSKQRYEELLRGQGMSPPAFEARVRQELMRQQLLAPFTENAFVSNLVAERVMRLSDEKREVSLLRIQPEQFLSQMKPDDAAIKAYYEAHKADFQLPEQVRVEYVVLSLDELAKQSQVSTDEATAYFETHLDEFGQPEERRASHILISAPSSVTAAERAAARVKAEQLLAEIKQDPERFADLARQHSQDPGSAPAGGDLGFFGRNMMTKSFEDAVFQMKPDQVSGLVETEHGFHIIKLAEIKGGKQANFKDVKSQVEQEVKKQKAAKLFGEMADNFSNTVYEQSDSLKPAAENFGLTIQQSGWIGRSGGKPPYFTNERLLMAIFSDDAIKDKRNTEAVEVSPNTLVSARVLEYKPATTPSLAELRDKIADRVAREEASKAALSEGKEKLAELQKGKDEVVKWGASQQVSRKEPQGLDNETVQAVFKAEATGLPSYYGLPNSQGGFTLIRVERVIERGQPDPAEQKAFTGQLQQLLAQEELSSYLESIKKRYDVSVRNENIEK
ncbi:MAG TPA: SurA N-terminal domain-containing protein [Nitrosospira sp.]|nr:SurA N-terminal domain-containing protein [Nitrosospira sp.]